MGMKKIEKPDCWCKEYYIQEKKNKKTDKQIAANLFVSLHTIYRWKKELGLKHIDMSKYYFELRKGMLYKKL